MQQASTTGCGVDRTHRVMFQSQLDLSVTIGLMLTDEDSNPRDDNDVNILAALHE